MPAETRNRCDDVQNRVVEKCKILGRFLLQKLYITGRLLRIIGVGSTLNSGDIVEKWENGKRTECFRHHPSGTVNTTWTMKCNHLFTLDMEIIENVAQSKIWRNGVSRDGHNNHRRTLYPFNGFHSCLDEFACRRTSVLGFPSIMTTAISGR